MSLFVDSHHSKISNGFFLYFITFQLVPFITSYSCMPSFIVINLLHIHPNLVLYACLLPTSLICILLQLNIFSLYLTLNYIQTQFVTSLFIFMHVMLQRYHPSPYSSNLSIICLHLAHHLNLHPVSIKQPLPISDIKLSSNTTRYINSTITFTSLSSKILNPVSPLTSSFLTFSTS